MDKKIQKYIGYILVVVTLLLGLNALFGGNPVVVGGYALLPIFAILTSIYYFYSHKKKA